MKAFFYILEIVCFVGFPLLFIAGLVYPLVVAWFYRYMDPHTREIDKRSRRRARAERALIREREREKREG